MWLSVVLFRAQFRIPFLCLVESFASRKSLQLNKHYFNYIPQIKNLNSYRMPKRKRGAATKVEMTEDIEEIEESNKKNSNKKKTQTRPRGKVSKNPTVKPKSVESEDESDNTSDISEPLEEPAKKGRGKKANIKENDLKDEKEDKKGRAAKETINKNDEIEEEDSDEVPAKKGRITKAKTTKGKTSDAGDKPAPKNKTTTSYEGEDFTSCDSKNGKEWNFKISNWNVDGIRAWLKKGGLEYIGYEKPDILCLQETKCSDEKLPKEIKEIEGYKAYWLSSEKDGYAGVGLYSRTEPLSISYGMNVEEHDSEGRMITAEYEHFYVISVYVPNAGRGLVTLDKKLDWNQHFRKYINELDKKKPVIICGDMNVAHSEIDLANPKTNHKNAGFTKEEREGMTEFLGDGFVDTFRHLYPDKTQAYTFWSYMSNARAKNVGWRLDYFIVSKRYVDNICDNIIRSQVFGSDHCPISLFLSI